MNLSQKLMRAIWLSYCYFSIFLIPWKPLMDKTPVKARVKAEVVMVIPQVIHTRMRERNPGRCYQVSNQTMQKSPTLRGYLTHPMKEQFLNPSLKLLYRVLYVVPVAANFKAVVRAAPFIIIPVIFIAIIIITTATITISAIQPVIQLDMETVHLQMHLLLW